MAREWLPPPPDGKEEGDEVVAPFEQDTCRLGFNGYFLLSSLPASMPCIMTILLWSSMGYGQECLKFVMDDDAWVMFCCVFVLLVLLFVSLYLLDFFWPPHLPGQYMVCCKQDRYTRRILIGLMGLGLVGSSMLAAGTYPWVPMIVTVLCGPICLAAMKALMQPTESRLRISQDHNAHLRALALLPMEHEDAREFYAGAMVALTISGSWTTLAWVIWILNHRVDLVAIKLGEQEQELQYLLAIAPLVAGLANLTFAFIVQLRVRLSRPYEALEEIRINLVNCATNGGLGNDNDVTSSRKHLVGKHLRDIGFYDEFTRLSKGEQQIFEQRYFNNVLEITRTLKVIGSCFLLILGGVYVSMKLVAADSHLAQLLLGFIGMCILVFMAFLISCFGMLFSTVTRWWMECPLGRMTIVLSESNWLRALVACVVLPLLPFILVVSAVNQLVRRCRGLYRRVPPKPKSAFTDTSTARTSRNSPGRSTASFGADISALSSPEEHLLTERVMRQLHALCHWDWVAIVPRVYLLALLLVVSTLSLKLLNVCLAFLISLLRKMPFGLVCFLTVVSGIICFLLPPVPGLPVYVFAGVICAQTCPLGFWAGTGIAVALGFVLKLMACALQQKCFGERLGKSMWIKNQVGVNKPLIRAIEAVLRDPGWSMGKVSILCGGPDWPTSVLAGLLGLPLSEMELGTLPIVFFVTPCTLSGSFYSRAGESATWNNAASLMVASTVVVNGLLWVAAAWCIQDKFDRCHWEITKPRVDDVDLDWLDYCNVQLAECCEIHWWDVPRTVWGPTILGLIIEVFIGHLFYWYPSAFFGTFEVTSDLASLQMYGESGLIKMPGLFGLCCSAIGFLGLAVLYCYIRRVQAEPFALKWERLRILEASWKDKRVLLAEKASRRHVPSVTDLAFMGSSYADFELTEARSIERE